MLVTLCDYKQSVTLIADSSVQFLDFGLTPQSSPGVGRFVRKTANGPLLRLSWDAAHLRYTLAGDALHQPEVVKPESTLDLHHSLSLLDGVWLPLPFSVLIRHAPSSRGLITGRACKSVNLKHPTVPVIVIA
jgi:Uncharacterized protein conserved in bacteria, putative virulence factor